MASSKLQLVVLLLLLGGLGATVYIQTADDAPAGTPQEGAAATTTPGAPARAIPVTGLNLDMLTPRSQEMPEVTRNPFRFRPRVAPAAARASVAPPTFVPPPAPTGPPPPPPIPLKFIGVLDAPERIGRLAILSDGRGGVFYGKEGDTIEGRYRVLKISPEAAELAYMDGRGRQTIRLTGQ